MIIAAVDYEGTFTGLTVAVQDDHAALDAFQGMLAGNTAGELAAEPAGWEWADCV
ncbi:hypothetical protein GCM10009784_21650 [Arthrobacter parietis]|uniref:Uncharacterized protein n=2 Tax=Arthrobacter TaxID=1663 RepID=A0ABT6CR19_9MICC|nr:hypothetical protein [Arthrobacter vasquezii]MDF9276533.1 hypothetical protein [Arthrobacter vasquezii]